jgi:hypothetical protein
VVVVLAQLAGQAFLWVEQVFLLAALLAVVLAVVVQSVVVMAVMSVYPV